MDFDSKLRVIRQSSVELKRVLIAEPDRIVQRAMTRLFEDEGYIVDARNDGKAALEAFYSAGAVAVILDAQLPFISGKDVCREIKRLSAVPIVIIGALGNVIEKIRMLELGADDYVTKPFSPRELLARVRALIRHTSRREDDVAAFDSVRIDFVKMEATLDGRPVHLTANEFKLLKFFLQREERVLSHNQILRDVFGYTDSAHPRAARNYVLNLRQKLERDPANPTHFLTVRGMGYRFVR